MGNILPLTPIPLTRFAGAADAAFALLAEMQLDVFTPLQQALWTSSGRLFCCVTDLGSPGSKALSGQAASVAGGVARCQRLSLLSH